MTGDGVQHIPVNSEVYWEEVPGLWIVDCENTGKRKAGLWIVDSVKHWEETPGLWIVDCENTGKRLVKKVDCGLWIVVPANKT